jgi:hypothetical protein
MGGLYQSGRTPGQQVRQLSASAVPVAQRVATVLSHACPHCTPHETGSLSARVESILALTQASRDAEALTLARALLAGIGDGTALPPLLPVANALNQLGMFFALV